MPVCADCPGLGNVYWLGDERLRHTFDAGDQSHADLQKTGNLRAVQLLLAQTKMGSTLSYLRVELEGALAIAESIEIYAQDS